MLNKDRDLLLPGVCAPDFHPR